MLLHFHSLQVAAVVSDLFQPIYSSISFLEAAALALGQDHDFLVCLVDWCAVEEHAGVKGENLTML